MSICPVTNFLVAFGEDGVLQDSLLSHSQLFCEEMPLDFYGKIGLSFSSIYSFNFYYCRLMDSYFIQMGKLSNYHYYDTQITSDLVSGSSLKAALLSF